MVANKKRHTHTHTYTPVPHSSIFFCILLARIHWLTLKAFGKTKGENDCHPLKNCSGSCGVGFTPVQPALFLFFSFFILCIFFCFLFFLSTFRYQYNLPQQEMETETQLKQKKQNKRGIDSNIIWSLLQLRLCKQSAIITPMLILWLAFRRAQ